jgi:c-di-GMP-binding flagellar brake protein YcgR
MSSLLDLEVHLSTAAGCFLGRCLDLGPGQEEILASVEFEKERAPLLKLGEAMELEFRDRGVDFSLRTEAVNVFRTDDAVRRRYSFRGSLSKRVFFHLLNRRRSLRVPLPPSREIRATLTDLGDRTASAKVHDVSRQGLSILLAPEFERILFERLELRLAVELPPDGRAVELVTTIRHRRMLGTELLYGLEIGGELPEHARARERFLQYVDGLSRSARHPG